MWRELLMDTYRIALPIILGYIVYLLKVQNARRDANSRGTMLLLRERLIEYHDRYMESGHIPMWAYQCFVDMYETYVELGGNGMIPKMKEEIDELHLRSREV